MAGPLQGVKVVEAGSLLVGSMAAGKLGWLGADVIRIEPPAGDSLMYGPGAPIGGMSSSYIFANFNKRNIQLDLKCESGKRIALELMKKSDVWIENWRPGVMDRLGLGYDVASRSNPRLIYISSPGFGRTGPWVNKASNEGVGGQTSGFISLNGKEGGPAETSRGYALIDLAGTNAVLQCALLGLNARELIGKGQKIDTSQFEAAIALQTSRIAEFFATGKSPPRLGSASARIVPSQSFRTLDNRFINISVPREEFWHKLCQALDLERLEKDPRFESNEQRVKHRAELIPVLEERLAQRPARWWLLHLPRHDVPCGSINGVDEIAADPQAHDRGMVLDIDTAWGRCTTTNSPWKFSRTPAEPYRPTVYPDSNRGEILAELATRVPGDIVAGPVPHSQTESGPLPLDGVKVIDLTEEIAGPYCTMMLGDAGAEVIKVEGLQGDWSRRLGPLIKNESALFLGLNRNKKSIAVDTRKPEGQEIVHRLAEDADIFVESFRPGDADRRQLAYEHLRRINHRLIYCSISSFGQTGQYRDRYASELELQGTGGLMMSLGQMALGTPGETPVRLGADLVATNTGIDAFCAILAALYHRNTGGCGQSIDISMFDTVISLNGHMVGGNSSPDSYGGMFVSQFLPPRTGYETQDRPIQFSFGLRANEETQKKAWEAFCKALGLEARLADPWFRDAWRSFRPGGAGVVQPEHAKELKQAIQQAFAGKTAEELIDIIAQVGGNASPILSYDTLYGTPAHPQVLATEMVREIPHPACGLIRQVGIPWKLGETPAQIKSPPPALGQHTEELLARLGYAEAKVKELRAGKVIL